MLQTIGSKDEVNNTKRSPKYRKDLHWTICFHWSAQYSIEIALRWAIRQESGPKCTQEIALSWTIRLRIRLQPIASRPGWCLLRSSTRSAFQHRGLAWWWWWPRWCWRRGYVLWLWWTQCAHYHFPWKPFINLGLHPDTLLYPGMCCRKQSYPTLLCHKHT